MAERDLPKWIEQFRLETIGNKALRPEIVEKRLELANLLTRGEVDLHGVTFQNERKAEVRQKAVKWNLPDLFSKT